MDIERAELYLNKSLFVKNKMGDITDQYSIGKVLGKGAYGTVFLAKLKGSNRIRAIKQIKKLSVRNPATLMNEIEILKKLDHPNIIKIYETFEDDNNYFLVTDVCEGGELFDKLIDQGSFNEDDARQIFRQILYAIKYCHNQKVAHRDLKPENFLLLDRNSLSIKLIDFGLSFQWKESMREELKLKKQSKLIGTSYYIAPEILKGQYDQRCDIWSLGVILYVLLTAVPPFDGDNDRQILDSVKKGVYTLNIPEMKNISLQAKDLIYRILKPENQRFTIDQIYQHPWMYLGEGKLNFKVNFNKIMNFSKYSKLKTFTAACIAAQMPGKQIQKLGQQFDQIDIDHDGFITVEEMKQALQKQNQYVSQAQLTYFLNYLDTDRNKKINYSEFIACFLENSTLFNQENLAHVFQSLDTNRDGKITREQLKNTMSKHGLQMERVILQQIIQQCDKNGDGQIDFREFLSSLSQL